MDGVRFGIGVVARLVFWLAALLIVGNAAVYLWDDGAILYSILSVAIFPATLFLWPWFSPEAASAWPFDDSVYLIYLFLVCVVTYPVSTIVGGLVRSDEDTPRLALRNLDAIGEVPRGLLAPTLFLGYRVQHGGCD